MLKVTFPSNELYDESKEEFINIKEKTVLLEHSLVSISKWEAKWKKAFLGKNEKTEEESMDYIRCMMVTPNVDHNIMLSITNEIVKQIDEYIGDSMTATTINSINKEKNRDIVTSELIYYWMVALNIPFECQKWHLNRLLTLISVCNVKNSPPKKMSKKEIASRNKSINAARKKQFNHKG